MGNKDSRKKHNDFVNMTTRLVIDKNCLESQKLDAWLNQSNQHRAVLTDYLSMEAVNAPSIDFTLKSTVIFGKYLNQIDIAHPLGKCTSIIPKANIARRVINKKASANLGQYIKGISAAIQGNNPILSAELERRRIRSKESLRSIGDGLDVFLASAEGHFSSLSAHSVKKFRTQQIINEEFLNFIIDNILLQSSDAHVRSSKQTSSSIQSSIKNTVKFRYIAANYAMMLYYYRNGGFSRVSEKKIRNDLVDATYVTFATIFDGIMTEDSRLYLNYRLTKWILKYLFPEHGEVQSKFLEIPFPLESTPKI